jgi:hypothetical protein
VIRLRLPNARERVSILAVHMCKLECEPDVDRTALGARTAGLSGAELANLANEAALAAVRHGRVAVRMADFEEALLLYRTSRTFGGAAGASGESEDGGDGGGDEVGGVGEGPQGLISPALLAAMMHSLQTANGGEPRVALG